MAEMNQPSNTMHWLLGAALLLIGVFVVVALVMVNSQAVNVTTTTQVDNVAPTVSNLVVNSTGATLTDDTGGPGGTLTLAAGANKSYFVNGVVTDLNGDADIVKATVVFYRSGVGAGCSVDKNSCYKVDPCTLNTAYGTGTEASFSCQVDLAFWTDSTSTGGAFPGENWFALATGHDEVATGTATLNKEVATLLALNIPNAINYGTRALGSTTLAASNQHQTIEQYGNDEADVEVSSSAAMSCAVRGSIPVANQQWSLTDVDYGAGGTNALTGSAVDTALAVGYRTDDVNPLSKILYWNIGIPASGVEGACTGTTVETAIAA